MFRIGNRASMAAIALMAAALGLALVIEFATFGVEGQSNFSVEYDVDRGGSDYRSFDLVRPAHELCRDACAGDANCRAYTYTKPYERSPARCFLKNAVPNPVPYRSCCISGVKNTAFGGGSGMGQREDNVSLQGTNLSYYARPAFETCQSDCINNGSCKGFTWIQAGTYSPNDSAMCYLMSAVTGRSAARGHYSGVKGASSGGGGGGGGNPGGGGGTFAGKWRAYGWEFITITQNGNSVTGKYSDYTGDRYPKGSFTGTVQGDKLFFSWKELDGNVGEAYLFPFDNGKRWGLRRCFGVGCNPVNSDKYSEAYKE